MSRSRSLNIGKDLVADQSAQQKRSKSQDQKLAKAWERIRWLSRPIFLILLSQDFTILLKSIYY